MTLQCFGPLQVGRNASENNPQCLFSMCWLGRNHMFFTSTKNTKKSAKNRLFIEFLTYVRKNGLISAPKLSSQHQPCNPRIQMMYEEHFQNIETTLKVVFGRAEVTWVTAKMLKNDIFRKFTFWISAQFGPKRITSARVFWIQKKHQKCYLTTFYNVWIAQILFDVAKVEIS